MRKIVVLLAIAVLMIGVATPTFAQKERLILATTTSTQDSGLLDVILPDFEAKFNADIDVISVGTGQALKLGENGDADVVLVHARAAEDKFVADGFGTERFDVMFNDFVIVGPESDPAEIKDMATAAEALTSIANAKAIFVSRGDDSGTHTREKSLWKAANLEPAGEWYQSAGQGMGATLGIADEQKGYTLTDRATYVARKAEGLELVILVEGDKALLNPYGVIAVNPEKHPNVNFKLATAFVEWITSVETQQMIADFEISGEQVFFPESAQWKAAQATPTPEATAEATKAP